VLVEGSVIYFNNKLEEGTGAMGFALNDGDWASKSTTTPIKAHRKLLGWITNRFSKS
jgi:hypothetical protein